MNKKAIRIAVTGVPNDSGPPLRHVWSTRSPRADVTGRSFFSTSRTFRRRGDHDAWQRNFSVETDVAVRMVEAGITQV